MKPEETKPEIVFRIIDRTTGLPCGSYSRAYCDEFDFKSAEQAREANVHGEFQNKERYAIAKYRVTYELLESECDSTPEGAGKEYLQKLSACVTRLNSLLENPEPGLATWCQLYSDCTKELRELLEE